jgi:secreted trypsin-like serine protease
MKRKLGAVLTLAAAAVVTSAVVPLGDVSAQPPATQSSEIGPAIVGGKPASETYPFMGSLQEDGDHSCGAALITARWMVTAAHCISNPPGSLQVRIGSTDRTKGGTLVAVKKIVKHPGFPGKPRFADDIALLELAKPVTATSRSSSARVPRSATQSASWAGVSPAVTTGARHPSDCGNSTSPSPSRSPVSS